MAKRKGLSKKLRFEVFKRDSFKCQYCGRTAPDTILEVDHIKPVKDGGTNDISNLITSCKDCNIGKGARLLSDDAVIQKQRQQLEELNERREQLEMMMKWREGLMDLEKQQMKIVDDHFYSLTGYTLNENGYKDYKKALRQFGLQLLLDSIEESASQYLVRDNSGKATLKSVEKVFRYALKICRVKVLEKEKPYIKDLFYIRGILRKRLPRIVEWQALNLLENFINQL